MLDRQPQLKLWLRHAASGLARRVLRARAVPLSADPAGVTLVLAPHQDDEVLGCGGLIAARRRAGHPVHVAYVTDGSASHPGHPELTPERLVEQRAAEARAALRMLGVESPAIHFLGARDGTLDRLAAAEAAALTTRLERLLREVQPTEVFLPCRDDGSSEHEAAFRFFARACASAGLAPRVCEFPVWSWWNPRLLARPLRRSRRVLRFGFSGYEFLKARALAACRSQTEPVPPWTDAVLSPEFCRMFLASEEFFFES